MKRVVLIRHAQSEENIKIAAAKEGLSRLKSARFPTLEQIQMTLQLAALKTDEPLSNFGRTQVQDVAEKVAKHNFGGCGCTIYHSPLLRARHTAQGLFPTCQHAELDFLREESPVEILTFSSGLDKRISEFQNWLSEQSAEIIFVVGHSRFFRRMIGMDRVFENCSVVLCTFATDYQETEKWRFEGVLCCADGSPDCDFMLDETYVEEFKSKYCSTTAVRI